VVHVTVETLAVPAPLLDLSGRVDRFRRHHPVLEQLARYAVVGGLGTAVNAVIFLALRTWFDAVPANLVALLVSTAVSTEANRRFTFEGAMVRCWRAGLQTAATVVFYAFYSSAVLLLLGLVIDDPSPLQETMAVAAASVLGGLGRFLVMRYWVFGGPAGRRTAEPGTVDVWDVPAPSGRSQPSSRAPRSS
jgi:putative flippase GtrA